MTPLRAHTQIEVGSVLDVLAGFADNSFDALMCDPPYGFRFMCKSWDYDVPSVETWAECLRVLKPGAPLVAFGGSRTYHRLACAVEDAGFELRDQLMWLYAKGFPKSQNIALAIDKSAGAERPVTGTRVLTGNAAYTEGGHGFAEHAQGKRTIGSKTINTTAPATDLAKAWDGYGTALKPAFEPIVLARKPLDGTMSQNVERWGVGGLSIDACRIGGQEWTQEEWTAKGASRPTRNTYGEHKGSDTDVPRGRWPANLILDEEAGALLDEEAGPRKSGVAVRVNGGGGQIMSGIGDNPYKPKPSLPNLGYMDGKTNPSRFFFSSKVSAREREAGCEGLALRSAGEVTGDREDGSAGLDSPRTGAGRTGGAHNHHPTLKPLSLTTWLARLILPPSPGAILVPFSGAGSEMIGARKAGWTSVFGIEREAEYAEIARARVAYWCSAPGCLEFDRQLSLLSVVSGK